MAQKTRQQIKSEVRIQTADFLGSGADASGAFILDSYINDVTNDLCRATGAYYYDSLATTIKTGARTYCAPGLYAVVAATVTDSSGYRYPIRVTTPRDMDQEIGGFWRTQTSGNASSLSGRPYYCYLQGEGSVGIYPVPDYNTQVFAYTDLVISSYDGNVTGLTSVARPFVAGDVGDLVFITGGTGFNLKQCTVETVVSGTAYVSGNAGAVGSVAGTGTLDTGGLILEGYGVPPDWPAANDVCPLQSENHTAVVYGVAVRYCELKLASDNDREATVAARLLPRMELHYREHRGMLEAEIAMQSEHSSTGHGR